MALKNLKLDRLSAKELLDLEKKTQAAYEKLRQKEKRALLRRWRGEAKANGFEFEEIIEQKVEKKKRAKVPMKYKNPEKASDVWSGRGRTPRWMQALLDKGMKKEQFLLKK